MKVAHNFLLKKITSTGVGGPARFFVKVKDKKELIEAMGWAETRKLKWLVIGDGTNLIPDDQGFDGLIIQNKIEDFQVDKQQEASLTRASLANRGGVRISVGAGNNLFSTIRRFNRLGLAGMEKMAGIPGTVGGAIYGCAGAYGQEIKDHLVGVWFLDVGLARFRREAPKPFGLISTQTTKGLPNFFVKHSGAPSAYFNTPRFAPRACLELGQTRKSYEDAGLQWFSKEECRFNYRDSVFKKHPEWIIVAAEFRLAKDDPKILQKTSAEIVKIRSRKYPTGLRCPGSFFKNILISRIRPAAFRRKILAQIQPGPVRESVSNGASKLPAAYFLEQIGAKGIKKGGITVADHHANLIYNTGKGRSDDMRALANLLKNRVKKKFGIELEEEVRYLS